MFRRKMSRSGSKRYFKRASYIHPKNRLNPRKMRGGIRL